VKILRPHVSYWALAIALAAGCSGSHGKPSAPDAGMAGDMSGSGGGGSAGGGGNAGGGGAGGGSAGGSGGAGGGGVSAPPDLASILDMALDTSGAILDPSGICVEVAGDATADGTAVQLGTCSGGAGQKWLMDADGTIRSLGKCMDATMSGTTNGTLVQLWTCNGSDAQEWITTATKQLINPYAGKCLDATGGSSAAGTRLQLYDCSGGDNQSWTPPAHGITNGRVVVYYQTQYSGSTYFSPLPLTTNGTRVSDVAVAAFHLQSDFTVHLNNDPPSAAKFMQMWQELAMMQAQGVRVEAMIGGAAKGSFAGLDTDFTHYYPMLKSIVETYHLDGVDLDVEEKMSLAGIEKVIKQLRSDYGDAFVITLAPVAAALHAAGNVSGFDYEQLYRDVGYDISWLNLQFYDGWGSFSTGGDYDTIVGRALVPAEKLVAGVLSNSANGGSGFVSVAGQQSTVKSLLAEHRELGGVASWEYFNSLPGDQAAPWQWASTIATALGR
jgi:hypothetical protein